MAHRVVTPRTDPNRPLRWEDRYISCIHLMTPFFFVPLPTSTVRGHFPDVEPVTGMHIMPSAGLPKSPHSPGDSTAKDRGGTSPICTPTVGLRAGEQALSICSMTRCFACGPAAPRVIRFSKTMSCIIYAINGWVVRHGVHQSAGLLL